MYVHMFIVLSVILQYAYVYVSCNSSGKVLCFSCFCCLQEIFVIDG